MQHRRRPETKAPGIKPVDDSDESSPPISAASAAGIFAEGARFGAYVIGPCIGHGGMARIYRAEHEGLCRQVALKVLTEGVEPGTEGRARFLREARIAAAIKHPNVVNIFDIGVENQIPYLVMELLVGQDLETLLGTHGALSEHTIIDIIIPVVAGLVAVHDAGVVHRDLKPGNIFLSKGANEEVEPKLLDFGISKAVGGADKLRLTSTQGLLMGTPLYMSPEALLGTDMTVLSDQYSLGVVLYECATGVNPFIADSVAETARRVTTGQFKPISEQSVRPSRRLQAIIERTMSLDPSQRFPDMRALGQELLTLAGQRTRITWGLTFGEVAAAVRAHHAKELDEEALALARTRPPGRAGRSGTWPLLAATCVGLASLAAVLTWSTRRPPLLPESTQGAPGPEIAASPRAATSASALVAAPAMAAASAAAAPPAAPTAAASSTLREEPRRDLPERQPARGVEPPPAPAPDVNERASAEALLEDALAEVESASAKEKDSRARTRPRPRVPPRVAPRAAAAESTNPLPESPEWMIDNRSEGKPRSTAHSPVQMGTNDAPIFD